MAGVRPGAALVFVAAAVAVSMAVGVPGVMAPAVHAAAASPFDACAPAAGQPWTQEQLLCLYRIGIRDGTLAETRARLVRIGAGQPDRPWPTLVLGYATQEQDETRALTLYAAAADGFARARDAEGEVLARHNLRNIYHRRGQSGEAAREVRRAVAAAEASKQPLAIARAAVLEAGHVVESGGDVGRAYRTLQRAKRFAFPSGPIGLRRTILINLANASFYLGRIDETIGALEQHRALRLEDGSTGDAAPVAFNLFNARLTQSEERPRPGARERLIAQAAEVLAEVEQLAQPAFAARVHRVLGDLLRTTDPDAAASHLRRCLDLEASLDYPEVRAGCLWTLSLLEAARDPQYAERASRQAIDALSSNAEGPLLVYAWQARLRLVWQTLPQDEAIPASLQALDAIERLRARQPDEDSRAALFSNWTRDFYWLTGRLLEANPPRLAPAFEVGERLRARVLLEHLGRAGRQQPATFASLDAVRNALDDSEAVLWYSVAPSRDLYGDFGGGAWLLSITRQAVRVHPLQIGADLASQVDALMGLLSDRAAPAESWEPAASRLGSTLLGPAIAALPSRIERLVIVSDGELHRLPFEALRPAARLPRLGERFTITLVPSATLWLQLRRLRPPAAAAAALVFADPDADPDANLDGDSDTDPDAHPDINADVVPDGESARSRAGIDLQLPRLPWARREAQAIARTLRLSASQVREGAAASERFLKDATLSRFAVLHFAAHARSDDRFPERAAVFLAPGDDREDGWLQPGEITALDLGGRLVVLSACESASGFLLSGEGPLSLARAFFAGGAGAVVATRWPLRDDDAAFVMERFYRRLAAGDGAAAALKQARADAIDRGLPAAAWAGLVLLGDGRRAPLAAVLPPPAALHLQLLGIAAAIGGGVLLIAVARGRRSRRLTRSVGRRGTA